MVKMGLVGTLLCLTLGWSAPALALHPDLVLPEKVTSAHKACQELFRLGKKYQVGGLFSGEFEAGKCTINRLDVAIAVQLLSERMADKALKEGTGAIDQEDLTFLSDLQEDLRGEMLLARTRTFEASYSALGTNLHPLTRNITLSGGLVGVVQGSVEHKPKNHFDGVARADLVLNVKVAESTIAVIDVEATGGDGIDAQIPSYSLLNALAGSTGDRVRFREAWLEHSAFGDKLLLTAGKIDLSNYFDTNAVANDETSQFLANAFVNSPVLGVPLMGPGLRLQARLSEYLILGIGYGSGDAGASNLLDHGYGIAEIDYRHKNGEFEGTYRFYGSLDGSMPEHDDKDDLTTIKSSLGTVYGAGFSFDQKITENLTIFGRYGWHDEDAYKTKSAWSLGLQREGLIPRRKDDVAGFAYGQVLAIGASAQEKLMEAYYRVKVSDKIAVSPHLQYLIDPLADRAASNAVIMGLRTQVVF